MYDVIDASYEDFCDRSFCVLLDSFMKRALPTPAFTEDAIRVLSERYFLKREGVAFENSSGFLARVALAVALRGRVTSEMSVDETNMTIEQADEYYSQMAALKFLPNSPTLMNAGTKIGNLAACFVVPVTDSLDEIYEGVKSVAIIHQSGGGTGMDFSRLRQKDAHVGSTGGVASGPISFIEVYNASTEAVKQGGKRRGANMGILRVDHPDIIEFIKAKVEDGRLANFNISVAITDEFMTALNGNRNGDGYTYPIRDPRTNEVLDRKDAREVWNMLVENAHKSGDPGIVFIDRINATQPFDVEKHPEHYIRATNPCGEQPLEDYEACNLASVNLVPFCNKYGFDWEGFSLTIMIATRFLDDVIDAATYPLPQIEAKVHENRKIGLGLMGFADYLIHQKEPYGSEKSIEMAEDIMDYISRYSTMESVKLAAERGAFPSFDDSVFAGNGMPYMRNATTTTIAPTGTISMIAGASSGVEPVFALAFTKTVMDGKKFHSVHPELQNLLDAGELTSEDIESIVDCGELENRSLLDDYPYLVTAQNGVTPEQHVFMQAAFQEYTDNAVSKTVNLPNDATVEDIDKIYRLSYNTGCKGITVFRDGCKSEQVLTSGTKITDDIPEVFQGTDLVQSSGCGGNCSCEHKVNEPVKRPRVLLGLTVKTETPCGTMYVTIDQDEDGQPIEAFTRLGKGGNCAGASAEVVGRMVSNMLRSGTSVDRVVKQLRGISCGQKNGFGANATLSCYDALGKVLEEYAEGRLFEELSDETELSDVLPDGPGAALADTATKVVRKMSTGACPDCGGPVVREEGCTKCIVCGFSKCG